MTKTMAERLRDLASSVGAQVRTLGARSLPAGGTTGQVLTKASGTDYDANWATPSGGSAQTSTAHRWWRVNATESNNSTYCSLAEAIFRTVAGTGVNPPAAGHSIQGSNYFSGSADVAFDGDSGSRWAAAASGVASGVAWVGWCFDAAATITQVALVSSGWTDEMFKAFTVDWSDDGATWTTVATFSGQTNWAAGELRTFDLPIASSGASALSALSDVDVTTTPPTNGAVLGFDGTAEKWAPAAVHSVPAGGAAGQVLAKASATDHDLAWVDAGGTTTPNTGTHRWWRLFATEGNSSTYCSLAELIFRETAGTGTNPPAAGHYVQGSNYFSGGADVAFDNNSGSRWAAEYNGITNGTAWVGWCFDTAISVAEVAVVASGWTDEMPKSFTVDWSDDGLTWTTALTVTAQTGWQAGELRSFALPVTPVSSGITLDTLDDVDIDAAALAQYGLQADYHLGYVPAVQKWVARSNAMPGGGSTGQVLAKASDLDRDVEWVDAAAASGGMLSYPQYRVRVTEANDPLHIVFIGELKFWGNSLQPQTPTGGTAFAGSVNGANTPAHAFDGDTSTTWACLDTAVADGSAWLAYDFGGNHPIQSIALVAHSQDPIKSPKAGVFEARNAGGSWVQIGSFSGQTDWAGGEQRVFPVSLSLGTVAALSDLLDVDMSSGPIAGQGLIYSDTAGKWVPGTATGPQGPKGDTGDQGIQGIQGAQGVQGPKGDPGAQGPKGDQGDQGVQGLQGIQGPQGNQGAQGPAGPGVPAGGGAGQILAKNSVTDYDTHWVDAAAGGGYSAFDTIAAATTLTTAQNGTFFKYTATVGYQITLPAASAATGVRYTLWTAGAYAILIGTENILGPGGSGTTTANLAAGQVHQIVSNGVNWIVVSTGMVQSKFVTITANRTVTVDDAGTFFKNTAANPTITLPDPSIMRGCKLTFWAYTNSLVLSSPGNILGPAGSGTTTQTIAYGLIADVLSDGTNWLLINREQGGTFLTSDLGNEGVGTIQVRRQTSGATVSAGATVAGSSLYQTYWVGASGTYTLNTTSTGTWRNVSGVNLATGNASFFQRIA